MCGPSQQEKDIAAQQQSMMQQYQQESAQYFATQEGVIANIQKSVQPILAAGPNQPGFNPAELSALDSGAITNTANQYRNAAVASGEGEAAASGNTYAPGGGTKELQAAIATQGAAQTSSELNSINVADYQTGLSNYWNAENALGGVATNQGGGSASLASTANNAGANAFSSADTVSKESNAAVGSIFGDILGVAAAPLTGGSSLLGMGMKALGGGGSQTGIGGMGAGGVDPFGQYS